MTRELILGAVLGMLGALWLGGCGERIEPPSVAARVAKGGPGQILYLTYCESCHGVGARGDGPAAEALRTPPADLTRLWESYGTPLDHEKLAQYIDGRQLLGIHDAREMPIWGEEFFEDLPSNTPSVETVKRRLIAVLVEYLDTLQSEQRI
jgi:mono/diheme cytochrome c family protein